MDVLDVPRQFFPVADDEPGRRLHGLAGDVTPGAALPIADRPRAGTGPRQ